MRLLYPYALSLLLLLPLLVLLQRRRLKARRRLALPISEIARIEGGKRGFWLWLHRLQEWGFLLALLLLIAALARPQQTIASWPVWGQGIDIALVLDTSSSMLQQDIKPNRMKVAKQLLRRFITFRRQRDDRLGLVLFAKEAYTLCPLTVDHRMLLEMFGKVQVGVIADDTALGDAMATALARLRHAPKRQRAILLVTDGENNAGSVHPLTAARLARRMQIPIFPLLMGKTHSTTAQVNVASQGSHLTPWQILQKVASLSRGSAYHAADSKSFERALLKILDQMTPTRAQKPRLYSIHKDLHFLFLWPALALLAALLLLQMTRLRTIP